MIYSRANSHSPQALQSARVSCSNTIEESCVLKVKARAGHGVLSPRNSRDRSALHHATPSGSRLVACKSRENFSFESAISRARSGVIAGPSATGMARDLPSPARIVCASMFGPPARSTVGQSPTQDVHNETLCGANISRGCHGCNLDSRKYSSRGAIIFTRRAIFVRETIFPVAELGPSRRVPPASRDGTWAADADPWQDQRPLFFRTKINNTHREMSPVSRCTNHQGASV